MSAVWFNESLLGFWPAASLVHLGMQELWISRSFHCQKWQACRESQRELWEKDRKRIKLTGALMRRFEFLFCCCVSALQVFLGSPKPTVLSPLLLSTVSTGLSIETPFTQESRLKALWLQEFFLGGRTLMEFLRIIERRLLPPKL